MEIAPADVSWKTLYKLMIGSIIPRPIGWITTVDPTGRPNLAPFSFFNAACANPPHVLFSINVRGTDGQEKDTLRNLRATGEFVVNIVTEALAEAMNLTSTEFPPEVNELEAVSLTTAPASTVRPPRVAESPVHYECQVAHIIELGTEPGGGSVVIGRVLHMHVDEQVMIGADKIDPWRLKAIGRLAGNAYCRTTEVFEMVRPASQIKPPSL